ncbi:MAG: DNA-processing protein DprA, partial [Wenzhouxiangellaceae bacterium]|nr:DNA-processing protein DprA [Wenzhouxiangellaceae bacterium]
NATDNGLATARQLSGALASAGLVVTSGLAAGIDGAAHAAAIAAGGRTIAVAGTGPDRVYPARHRELAHRIVDNGAVVSSFAPGVGPRAAHFPARNRIISGMSAGVVVVEAGLRSGSLITARLAGEQGREVFAVPGSVRNPVARGCHRLIRQGARLVETAEDVFDDLRPLVEELAGELRVRLQTPPAGGETAPTGDESASGDDDETRRLLQAVGFDPTPIDEIIERTRLTTPAVSSMLLMLELEGRVTSHGGGRYSRTGNDLERN